MKLVIPVMALAALLTLGSLGAAHAETPTPAPTPAATDEVGIVVQIPKKPTGGGDSGDGGGGGGSSTRPPTPAPTPPPTEPAVTPKPATSAEKATLSADRILAGGALTVTASGFTPGEQVQLVVYSEPWNAGSFLVGPSGKIQVSFQVPKGALTGEHVVQLTGWSSDRIAQAPFTVTSPVSPAASGLDLIPWIAVPLVILALFMAALIVLYVRRWLRHESSRRLGGQGGIA